MGKPSAQPGARNKEALDARKKLFKTSTSHFGKKKWKKGKQEEKLLKQREEQLVIDDAKAKAEAMRKRNKQTTVTFDNEEGLEGEGDGMVTVGVDKDGHLIRDKIVPKNYSISMAVPGSFLNNAQSEELRSYMAGQIARAATLYCVDEIIVYDETARMTREQVDAYWSGAWRGDQPPTDQNLESNMYLARILEYLECPQYLRRAMFRIQRPLKYAGLLMPLDSQHHLKADDLWISYREGVVLNKPVKDGRGPLCDVGLDRELQVQEQVRLPPGTRVTVEMNDPKLETGKRYRGSIISNRKVREKTGLYWGYTVNLVKSLGEVLDRKKYDVILGTSPRGKTMAELNVNCLTKVRVLVVFAGIEGAEAAVEADEALDADSPELAFDMLVNPLPGKGARSERVEENVLVSLSQLTMRLEQLS